MFAAIEEMTVRIKIHSFGIFLTLLSGLGSGASAQTAIVSSESFDYFRCSELMQDEEIEGFFVGVTSAVELYNSQSAVDVKMEMPKKEECYISVGRPGSMFEGVPFLNYYTSYSHLECSARGDCSGNLAGYQAGAVVKRGGAEITANTNKYDDAVVLCFGGGDISSGHCD
jgi:hypothetical protein